MAETRTTTVKGAGNVTPSHIAPVTDKTRKPRTPIDPNETTRQKFLRLGGVRMAKALQAIKVIGNLANPAYEYTPADVEKMHKALTAALTDALSKFVPKTAGEVKKAAGFQF